MTESIELFDDIADLLRPEGLELVEFHLNRRKAQASAIVYRASGTGIDECSKAHRLIQARLEAALGTDDFHLETASPGIDRTMASAREYGLFAGRGVSLFLVDEDVIRGTIASADDSSVSVADASGDIRVVPFDSIRKGKLDYSQEGR